MRSLFPRLCKDEGKILQSEVQELRWKVWPAARGPQGLQRQPSESKTHTNSRPTETHALQQIAVPLVVFEMAIGQQQIAPRERVSNADEKLPGQIGVACANVDMKRREPVAIAEAETPRTPMIASRGFTL